MVPSGWEIKKLKDLGDGKLPAVKAGPFGSSLKKEFYVEAGYKIYGQEQVISGDAFYGSYYIDRQRYESLKSCAVKAGDILISLVGTVGRVLLLPQNCESGVINPRLLRLSLSKDKAFGLFFKYFLEASHTSHTLLSWAQGGTMGVLNAEMIKNLSVPLPPLPEQKKIAEILSTWDKAITTTEQLLANRQQQKKALMQQLLTDKKRLHDQNGQPFTGEWEALRLKNLLREEKSRNKNNDIERVLSVTNHSGFVLPEDQFSKRVASDDVSNYKVVKKGQFGYNPSRLNVGSFARLDNYEEGLLSPMYVVFSVDEQYLNSNYFLNWMNSNDAKQRIAGSTQGSVRDSVSFDALCGFPFMLAPMEQQQKIAAVLTAADKEIDTLKQKLDHLKQEKKALMQQLLTGKRRVSIGE